MVDPREIKKADKEKQERIARYAKFLEQRLGRLKTDACELGLHRRADVRALLGFLEESPADQEVAEILQELLDEQKRKIAEGENPFVEPTPEEIGDYEIALGHLLDSRHRWGINIDRAKPHYVVVITIVGATDSGKSNAAMCIARQLNLPVIYIDPADTAKEKLEDDTREWRIIKGSEFSLFLYHVAPGKEPLDVMVKVNDRVKTTYGLEHSVYYFNREISELFAKRNLDKTSDNPRQFPRLQQIIAWIEQRKAKPWTKDGQKAESLLNVLDGILRGGPVFASDRGIHVSGLLQGKVIVEAKRICTLDDRLLGLATSLLVDQISGHLDTLGGLKNQARVCLIVDEGQVVFGKGAPLAREVLRLRQKGFVLVIVAQDISALHDYVLDNTHLFIFCGSQTDTWPITKRLELRRYEKEFLSRIPKGHALIWHRNGPYPFPFLVKFPHLLEQPYPEEQFSDLNQAFLKSLLSSPEQDGPAEPPLPAPEEKAEPGMNKLVDRFVESCVKNPWWGVTEHAKAIGAGKSKFTTIRKKAKAHGFIVEWPKIVDGQGGTKTLVEVTDVWFGMKSKKRPQRKGKGGFPHQYYQHTTFDVLKKHDPNQCVEIEGRVGDKNADVLVQHEDGTFSIFEIVSKVSRGSNEIVNIHQGLIKNPQIVRKHVIACENNEVLKKVKEDVKAVESLESFRDRIVVIKLTDLWKDPGKYISE